MFNRFEAKLIDWAVQLQHFLLYVYCALHAYRQSKDNIYYRRMLRRDDVLCTLVVARGRTAPDFDEYIQETFHMKPHDER